MCVSCRSFKMAMQSPSNWGTHASWACHGGPDSLSSRVSGSSVPLGHSQGHSTWVWKFWLASEVANNYSLQSSFLTPWYMPSTLHILSHLIDTITLWGKHYSSHFTDEEILLVSGVTGIWTQAVCFRIHTLNHHAHHLSPSHCLTSESMPVINGYLIPGVTLGPFKSHPGN